MFDSHAHAELSLILGVYGLNGDITFHRVSFFTFFPFLVTKILPLVSMTFGIYFSFPNGDLIEKHELGILKTTILKGKDDK